jgi:hypothetical protein
MVGCGGGEDAEIVGEDDGLELAVGGFQLAVAVHCGQLETANWETT